MAQENPASSLGSMQLFYERPLSSEHIRDLEDMVRQSGLQIHDCRRYTMQQADRTDHVVEIIANYDNLTADQWSDLVGLVKETYHDPLSLSGVAYNMRKRI